MSLDQKRERAHQMSWPVAAVDVLGGTPSDSPNSKCSAVPTAALHGWRDDIGCASNASVDIEYGMRVYPVCKMHRDSWVKAFPSGRHHELAKVWGWTRA